MKTELKKALKILAEAKSLYFDRDAKGIMETEDHKTLKPCLVPDFLRGLGECVAEFEYEKIFANGIVNMGHSNHEYSVSDKTLAKAVLHRLKHKTAEGFKFDPNNC